MEENREDKDNKLYIPVNIPDTDDYIMGLGYKELMTIGIMILILIFVCLIMITSSGKMIFTLAMGITVIFCTLLTIRKDMHRENLIKKIRIWRRYAKVQKRYEYLYYNIYEGFLKGDES